MGSLSPGDGRLIFLPRLSIRQSFRAIARVVLSRRMVRALRGALVSPSGRRISPICPSLLLACRCRRSSSQAPRSETAFLRHLSEHRGQRLILGIALGSVRSAGLRPVVSRSAYRRWGVSCLGARTPAVCLRCLRRGLRLRGRQLAVPPWVYGGYCCLGLFRL